MRGQPRSREVTEAPKEIMGGTERNGREREGRGRWKEDGEGEMGGRKEGHVEEGEGWFVGKADVRVGGDGGRGTWRREARGRKESGKIYSVYEEIRITSKN